MAVRVHCIDLVETKYVYDLQRMNSSDDLATNVSNMSVPSPPPVLALPPALLLGLVLLAYIPVAITSTTSLTTTSTISLISAIT